MKKIKKKIKIKDLIENKGNFFYTIAETAFSHEGDLDYLKKQIDLASQGDSNAVKFQILLDYKDVYSTKPTNNFENIPSMCFSEKEWFEMIKHARSKNLEIIILPIDIGSLKFIQKNLDLIDAIEIHSTCLNEVPFLQEIKKIPKIIILGIGGRTSEDIDFTLNVLLNKSSKSEEEIIMMLGFQSFPTDIEKLNLSKLESLNMKYQSVLGYADHTHFEDYKTGNELIKYAFLYGARIFEKHIVLNKGEKRVDYESAISYREFKKLRNEIESLINIMGNKDLQYLNESELVYKNREKQIVAMRDLKKGTILTKGDIGYKISIDKSDFEQKDYYFLLNKKLKMVINEDGVLRKKHVYL